jgi:hypothetical protein
VYEKIMGALDLPVDYSHEHKVSLWCNILAPQMTKTLKVQGTRSCRI